MGNPIEDFFLRCDGGMASPPNFGGSSYSGGGTGSYSGGSGPGKRSNNDLRMLELFKKIEEKTATPEEMQELSDLFKTKGVTGECQKDGGAQISSFGGGHSGMGSGSYSSSSGSPICCIGIIILIVIGLILNFIFHLELWLIAVILVVALIIVWVASAILD